MGAELGSSAYLRGTRYGDGHSEMVQPNDRLWIIHPDGGGADVFVHISAVERAGMHDLGEGQKIAYEIVPDKRSGKSSAENLKPA
jgi:CspA family cold shock protein